MPKKTKPIPVNTIAGHGSGAVSIERTAFNAIPVADKKRVSPADDGKQAHRHDGHSFFLLESGSIVLEIDFKTYTIDAPSVIYVHPDQVHRAVSAHNILVTSWSMTPEKLRPDYLNLLEGLTPAQPIRLDPETFSVLAEAVALCLTFAERKSDKLSDSMLTDSGNALVAFVISLYLQQAKPADSLTRFDTVTRAFRQLLERQYTTLKRPAAYAQQLHLSTAYLNECVKAATGYPVSYHIQQRIILEASRLLYHTDLSVKEIATALGYDDYPYFSRLFTKVTGMTALAFRHKNRD